VVATYPAPAAAGRRRFSVRTFDSLSDRSFRWFFFALMAWFASMNMQMFVRGWLAYELTGSYAALGSVALANAAPGMILALPGGVLADRIRKKRLVQAGQIANMALAGSIAVLLFTGLLTFPYLLVSAFIQGGVNAVIMPGRQVMISEIVEDERLMNAISLASAGQNVMRTVAPPVGGALLVLAGSEVSSAAWVYAVMALCYLVSGLFLAMVDDSSSPAPVLADRGSHGGGLSDLLGAPRYIRKDRVVLLVLATNFVIVLFSMPFQFMLPGYAEDVLGAGPGMLSILMSLLGVGALVGSLLVASLPSRRRGALLLGSAAILGVSLLLMSMSSWLWLSALIIIFFGMGQAGRMSLGNVLIQSYTPAEYRGRVMSVYMLQFSLMQVGTFGMGFLANAIGVQAALGGIAAILIVYVFFTYFFASRMRNLD
jgi:MFS family permease